MKKLLIALVLLGGTAVAIANVEPPPAEPEETVPDCICLQGSAAEEIKKLKWEIIRLNTENRGFRALLNQRGILKERKKAQ